MLLTRYSNLHCNQWGGFGNLGRLQNNFDRLFGSNSTSDRIWLPPVEVNEAKDQFLVAVELPGVKSSDVKVTLDDDVLTVSGERKYESAIETELRLSERYYGKFERSVRLPASVKSDQVTATGKDGILTITLPKTDDAKPREIKIADA